MQASFWLTSSCNMKCIYCYEGENKRNIKMEKQTIDRALLMIIRHMKELEDKYLWIVLHGGEPFLAFEEMEYLVQEARKHAQKNQIFISFSATSNGTLLNDKMITFIKKEIDDFTISMDGKAETQNYSRPFSNGRPSFDVVEKNLKKLLGIIPNLRVRMTYNYQTVSNLFENVKYFMEMGVKCVVPAHDFYDKNFKEPELNIIDGEIKKICQAYKGNEELLSNWKLQKHGLCSGGITSMHIDPAGKIYPCMLAVGNMEFIIGDIYNGIDSDKRRQILAYSEHVISECEGCDLYHYCNETRCRIINKIVNGNFTKPSPVACGIERIKYNIHKCNL